MCQSKFFSPFIPSDQSDQNASRVLLLFHRLEILVYNEDMHLYVRAFPNMEILLYFLFVVVF
jgi:hypothetical protein